MRSSQPGEPPSSCPVATSAIARSASCPASSGSRGSITPASDSSAKRASGPDPEGRAGREPQRARSVRGRHHRAGLGQQPGQHLGGEKRRGGFLAAQRAGREGVEPEHREGARRSRHRHHPGLGHRRELDAEVREARPPAGGPRGPDPCDCPRGAAPRRNPRGADPCRSPRGADPRRAAPAPPRGPPVMRWVARPAIPSLAIASARRALSLARSIATTTATPRAIPRSERASCQGWRANERAAATVTRDGTNVTGRTARSGCTRWAAIRSPEAPALPGGPLRAHPLRGDAAIHSPGRLPCRADLSGHVHSVEMRQFVHPRPRHSHPRQRAQSGGRRALWREPRRTRLAGSATPASPHGPPGAGALHQRRFADPEHPRRPAGRLRAVRRHHHRHRGLRRQMREEVDDLARGLVIEVAGGLVGEHQRRRATRRARSPPRCCSPPDSASGKLRAAVASPPRPASPAPGPPTPSRGPRRAPAGA